MKDKSMPLIFCTVFIVAIFGFVSHPESAEKTKISIQRFDVSEKLDPALSGFLYDMLLERMVAGGKYTVVDWEEIDRLLKYIEQSQPNVSEDEARKQAVNQLGIQKMYLGSITKIADKFYITVKVLNLDLTVEKVQKSSTKSEADLERSINEIVDNLLGLTKEPKDNQITGQVRRGRLFVETEPKDARIRILNIKPRFYKGMELEPGSYNVEVSADGFERKTIWVSLSFGEKKKVKVSLKSLQPAFRPSSKPDLEKKARWDPTSYSDIAQQDKTAIFFDDFNDNKNNWRIRYDSKRRTLIKNGYYYIESFNYMPKTETKIINFDENKNFEIETKMKFVKGNEKRVNYLNWGRALSNSYNCYKFGFSANHSYRIDKYIGKDKGSFSPYTIKTNPNLVNDTEYNKFTIRKIDSTYYFFLNEKFVHSIPFIPFFGHKIGFSVASNSVIHVDYLRISYLKELHTGI